MKFRQLHTLSYHYLVSDQDFKGCCDETIIVKGECTCLHEMVVLECLRHNKRDGYNCNRLFKLRKLRVSKIQNVFFLEVRCGCGSSTKIKTADIERVMCATVLTLKKNIGKGKSVSGDMHVSMIEINLHNITRYQKQRLFSFNCKCLQKFLMWSI